MPISMDVDMSSVLEEHVSSFLTDLDFTVFKDDNTVLPPKTKTCIVECIFPFKSFKKPVPVLVLIHLPEARDK
jgi:hypothetical protein